MKRLGIVFGLVVLLGGTAALRAADASAGEKPDLARLEARLLRLQADLVEARAAGKPDPARVDKLAAQVAELREKLQMARPAAKAPAAPAAAAAPAATAGGPGGCAGCCGCCLAGCPLAGGPAAGSTAPARAAAPAVPPAGLPAGRGPGAGMGPGRGMGPGMGRGMGRGMGPGGDSSHASDMEVFHYLLEHHQDIDRKVTKLADGVLTVTESGKPEVAAKIQEHAEAMKRRVEEGRPIHLRDPLFREAFVNADKIRMTVEKTPRGVKVRETSADAHVARVIQAHAEVVSLFVANGFAEMPKNHAVPK